MDLEKRKALHRFSRWCSRLSASQARSVRLFEPDPPFRPPVDVDAEDAVNVFLRRFPELRSYRQDLVEAAQRRLGGVLVMGKDEWAKEKAECEAEENPPTPDG